MKKLFLLLLVVVGFGCSSVKVSYDYDKESDFSKYNTYSLSEGAKAMPIQQLNRDRILNAVDKQMAAKGFTKVDSSNLVVDVHLVGKVIQTATARETGAGFGSYSRYSYGGGYSTTEIDYEQYTEGTLLITFVDMDIEQIVWQGKGTKILVEDAKTERREKNINNSVERIISKYPPEAK